MRKQSLTRPTSLIIVRPGIEATYLLTRVNNIHTCTRASVFVNDIHARLITFVNPEISCISEVWSRSIRISEGLLNMKYRLKRALLNKVSVQSVS